VIGVDVCWASVDEVTTPDPSTLSVAERDRAAAFTFASDAARFVGRRAFLRGVLSTRLGVAPADVELMVAAHGRPVLAGGELAFSTAHSDGLAVVALADDAMVQVGVDVERMRSDVTTAELAGRVLTEDESAAVTGPESLFVFWTVKEACLKAAGTGFQCPATDVVVTWRGDELGVDGWSVERLTPPRPGFVAALAVSRRAAPPAAGR
jgi:4'-phosphopantetheinyl transferase